MELSEKIRCFPAKPGVYWMKDGRERVLYVGKAKNLRARVKAYFGRETKERYQIAFLMKRTVDIEFLVTDTEKEALLLENTLIKKHNPRYNVFLKDDKNYTSLKINVGHEFPGLFVTRTVTKDGSLYFGPFSSGLALRETVDLLTRHFQLRTCSDHEFANRSRPCLEYQIGRCSAPCVGKISPETYRGRIESARLFLQGSQKELIHKLKSEMKMASENLQYESAARFRDLIRHCEMTLEKQKVVRHDGKDYDAIGFSESEGRLVFCVLQVRGGSLIDRQHFIFAKALLLGEDFLSQFLLQFYRLLIDLPPEILIPKTVRDAKTISEILEERGGHRVRIHRPLRGPKKKMSELAKANAAEWAKTKIDRFENVVAPLQKKLRLVVLPERIECVDISNLQGGNAVGSIVAFEDGKPLKSHYRKFKIRQTEGPNDYAMMHEVLHRRFRRALQPADLSEKEKWAPPDLLLVDGGKGQLQIALKVLTDLGLHNQGVVAIAKPHGLEKSDKIFLPGRKNPLPLKPDSPELLYLMRIRDEAHRFGLAYHRNLRSRKSLKTHTA